MPYQLLLRFRIIYYSAHINYYYNSLHIKSSMQCPHAHRAPCCLRVQHEPLVGGECEARAHFAWQRLEFTSVY